MQCADRQSVFEKFGGEVVKYIDSDASGNHFTEADLEVIKTLQDIDAKTRNGEHVRKRERIVATQDPMLVAAILPYCLRVKNVLILSSSIATTDEIMSMFRNFGTAENNLRLYRVLIDAIGVDYVEYRYVQSTQYSLRRLRKREEIAHPSEYDNIDLVISHTIGWGQKARENIDKLVKANFSLVIVYDTNHVPHATMDLIYNAFDNIVML